MTDIAQSTSGLTVGGSVKGVPSGVHTTDEARKRLKKRYSTERRFKAYGIGAIAMAISFLVLLLITVVGSGLPAFTYNYVSVPLNLGAQSVDPANPAGASYNKIIRDGLKSELPFASDRKNRRVLYGLVSSGANILLQKQVVADPSILGATKPVAIPLSDFADLYVKGLITDKTRIPTSGAATFSQTNGLVTITSGKPEFKEILASLKVYYEREIELLAGKIEARGRSQVSVNAKNDSLADRLESEKDPLVAQRLTAEIEGNKAALAKIISVLEAQKTQLKTLEDHLSNIGKGGTLNDKMPSFFVQANGGTVKVEKVTPTSVTGTPFIPLSSQTAIPAGKWHIEELETPQSFRKFSDKEIAYTDYLISKGAVENEWNSIFFNAGASREPEMAGIWGAAVGSFWTMLVTLSLSFPIGVSAAIYLEEFAPKNRWTQLIEVNINNLAAVPSIVFGLLGLAVFLNVFGLPRSAPVVGGMVLALMTLPTIIIASRAALQAVPPSIREAALGVGASRLQAVFHHVLPLAMPGILTGTIIGMAQALGETAPLLMIGMVAFIVDIPASPVDPSTVLPVQIFMWADFPEPAFQQKTSAAIMVLLGFLISMNAIALVLRKRFERRW
ncbi:Phosphate transport system permease protein PstA [Pseudovibrio axinellae]|uniref:Phosphate transport system permease protein PstA n=1 Tax=Pseudovibrio axinellae TaxID=989403 RepID=A0A165YIX6_9HYPH|nr:phosphate ABC transporter permease PstA [Pseudovibrio axinellae]KZL18883.1 Phosphate transport system permease protein PstA [Pseudovibrio axinellae]SEP89148.1 phosphate ABC transporter membrane protein 2, PhoT family [Pseudovibrio axinellae]